MKQQIKFGMTTTQVNVWQEEYKAGFDAQQRGLSYMQNPHKDGTVAHDAWKRGWNTASMAKRVMSKP